MVYHCFSRVRLFSDAGPTGVLKPTTRLGILLFVLGLPQTGLGAAPAALPQGDGNASGAISPCLHSVSWELQCRRTLDELVEVEVLAGTGEMRGWALNISQYFASTPNGAAYLREMLRDPHPGRAVFAARALMLSGDFANIEPLLACAEQHADDDTTVRDAISSVTELIASGEPGPQGPGRITNREAIARLRASVDQLSREGVLRSYEDLWGRRLAMGLKLVSAKDWDLRSEEGWTLYEGLGEAFVRFAYSRDSQRAAPLLFEYAASLNERHYKTWVAGTLFSLMQLYVGPIDYPAKGDLAQQRQAAARILEWWGQNKERRPVYWMLDRLARCGYATAKPEDAKTTADALVAALSKGTPAEQYAATRVLGYVLPDGGDLPAIHDDVLRPHEPSVGTTPAQDGTAKVSARNYLKQLVMYRAVRWAAWECILYSWDAREGRYVRKARSP